MADLLAYVAVQMATCRPASEAKPRGAAELDARADLWQESASKPIVRITAGRLMDDLARIGLRRGCRCCASSADRTSIADNENVASARA